jgi:hypothetical protein
MNLLERKQTMLDRINRLEPLGDRVWSIFVIGNREQLLLGLDAQGTLFAPLAALTLKRRRGSPEPGEAQRPSTPAPKPMTTKGGVLHGTLKSDHRAFS